MHLNQSAHQSAREIGSSGLFCHLPSKRQKHTETLKQRHRTKEQHRVWLNLIIYSFRIQFQGFSISSCHLERPQRSWILNSKCCFLLSAVLWRRKRSVSTRHVLCTTARRWHLLSNCDCWHGKLETQLLTSCSVFLTWIHSVQGDTFTVVCLVLVGALTLPYI